jgi:hypothetical protein
MNEIKYDLEKKLEGSQTYRGKNPKLINPPKQFNFPNSPKNKNTKYLNLGNINSNQISKYISKKGSSSSKIISENFKKAYKQNSTNNIINNQINKKENESGNEIIFQKGVLNEKLESFLFKNKLKAKKNNKLLNPKQKMFCNINNNINTRLKLNNENKMDKININSFMEMKYQPLISKFTNKRSTSVINANKANEKLKEINNLTYKDSLFMTKNNNEKEKVKMVNTPTKKIIFESDKDLNNIKNLNFNSDINNNKKINKKNKIELEENHFKAVIYTQEIKKLKRNLN